MNLAEQQQATVQHFNRDTLQLGLQVDSGFVGLIMKASQEFSTGGPLAWNIEQSGGESLKLFIVKKTLLHYKNQLLNYLKKNTYIKNFSNFQRFKK